jgi:hypothetical protein
LLKRAMRLVPIVIGAVPAALENAGLSTTVCRFIAALPCDGARTNEFGMRLCPRGLSHA